MKVLVICAIAVLTTTSIKAQFSTGADIVSSYVWRGVPQEVTKGTPNIQPYVSFTVGGLTVGSWASSSFLGNVKEVDLYATYAFSSSFALTVTDWLLMAVLLAITCISGNVLPRICRIS